MRAQAEQYETIGLMAAHESTIAELYRLYAERFPQCQELFLHLAADEVEHARMISLLASKVKAGQVQIGPHRFSSQAILTSLDYVRERLDEARSGSLSLKEALATSRDLEHGLIEKRFFDIIEEDGPEVQRLLQRLTDETSAHRARIDDAPCRAAEDPAASGTDAGQ